MSEQTVSTLFYQRLLDDHQDTRIVLETLNMLLQPGNISIFKEMFGELRQELKRHYACEEHGLFPVLNQYRTMVLMEKEHDDLLLSEQAVADALQTPDNIDRVREAFSHFQQRLNAHIIEEEQNGIFAMADKLLEPEEKDLVARKLDEVYAQYENTARENIVLDRPTPEFRIGQITSSEKPIAYNTLLEFEHTQVQHVAMKAGSKTQPHWSGQVLCLTVLSGELIFETAEGSAHQILTTDMYITIEPHLLFSLIAQTDCRYMLFKVWPKPHFLKN